MNSDGYVPLFHYGVVVCGRNDAEVPQLFYLLPGYGLNPLIKRLQRRGDSPRRRRHS